MTTTFTIIAGAFGLIAFALHREGLTEASRVFVLFSGVAFICALYVNINSKKNDSNTEERKILFFSALETIDARTRLTVEIVGKFRDTCKKYKYTMTNEQKKYMGHLLSAIGDVRIIDEELNGIGKNNPERSKLISRRRELLNRIEESKNVINKFLSKNT